MRKHLSLIIGFAIPVLLVIAVILSIYIPRAFIKAPQTNFLFMSNNHNYGVRPYDNNNTLVKTDLYNYAVENDHLVIRLVSDFNNGVGFRKDNLPPVYYYDVKKNNYSTVPTDKLASYTFTNTATSPDGFSITQGGGGGGDIFGLFSGGYRDYNSYYLTKSSYSQKLQLPTGVYLRTDYCYQQFECGFVGWVTGGGQ